MLNVPNALGSTTEFSIVYTTYPQPVKWDQQEVDQVLQGSQRALTLFNQAASKNAFQVPDYQNPSTLDANSKIYPMNPWREAARMEVLNALSLSWQGKTDQALQEAVKLNKVGHNIVKGHNSLIGSLVGISMEQLGSQTIMQILPYGTVSKQTLQTVASSVKNSSDDLEGYKDALRFDYTKDINISAELNQQLETQIQSMVQNGSVDPAYASYIKYGYYYKPNQTENLLTNYFNTLITAVGQECQLNNFTQQVKQNNVTPQNLIFTENAIGKMLYSVVAQDLSSVLTKECQNDLAANVAQTELALKQYQIDNGSLPQTLDALVPQYLDAMPLDPFDHQPIRYNAQKKILYSVGLNKQDLGGSTGADWTKMDNPTFSIGF